MKKFYKKNVCVLIISLLLTAVIFANVDTIIMQLNREINEHYSFPNYFYNRTKHGEFNNDIFNKYQVPVYGKPHGDYKNIDGVMEPRFIGYADNGESVPNPVFPVDELGNYELSTLPWVFEPLD